MASLNAVLMPEIYVREVVISTATLAQAVHFWCGWLGFSVLAEVDGASPALALLWQTKPEQIGKRLLLGQPDFLCRIHLVEVVNAGYPIRRDASALDALPKTLNLLVRNLPDIWQRLHDLGANMRSNWVEYELDGQRYRDAHLLGPDHSGIGLLEVLDADYPVNQFGIGEPASFTYTVERLPAEQAFYQALGAQLRLDRVFSGPAIEQLVGLPEGGSLQMLLFGPQHPVARLELVSYGIKMAAHYGKAVFPNTGLLWVHIEIKGKKAEPAVLRDATFYNVKLWQELQKIARIQTPCGSWITLSCITEV